MWPRWHFTSLKQCNILFVPKFLIHSLEYDHLPNELKPHSPHENKTSNKPALAQSSKAFSKGAPHTKSHCSFSPLLSNKSMRYTTSSFSIWLLPVKSPQAGLPNHFSTISLYTSMWLPIPCTCSPSNPHPQIYSTSSRIRIWNPVGGLQWSFFAETVNVLSPLAVFTEEFRHWCLTKF